MLTAGGREERVTRSECVVFEALARHPGRVVPHEELTQAIWSGRRRPYDSAAALRTHVYTLRRKLTLVAPDAAIESVPGTGYALHHP